MKSCFRRWRAWNTAATIRRACASCPTAGRCACARKRGTCPILRANPSWRGGHRSHPLGNARQTFGRKRPPAPLRKVCAGPQRDHRKLRRPQRGAPGAGGRVFVGNGQRGWSSIFFPMPTAAIFWGRCARCARGFAARTRWRCCARTIRGRSRRRAAAVRWWQARRKARCTCAAMFPPFAGRRNSSVPWRTGSLSSFRMRCAFLTGRAGRSSAVSRG